MLGQPQSHRRRAVVIATQVLPSQQPQGRLRLSSAQDAPIAVPASPYPVLLPRVALLDRAGPRLLDQLFARAPRGAGDHEATLPFLDEASAAFPLIRLGCCAFFSGRTT